MSEIRQHLLAAAERVLAGLDGRIDRSARSKCPIPVFEGIAELRDAIAAAKGATSCQEL